MNTTNAAVGIGTVVVLGRWSESTAPIDGRIIVGVTALAVGLAVLPDNLAQPFAWLVLIVVLFRYFPSIIGHTGLANTSGSKSPKRPPSGSTMV